MSRARAAIVRRNLLVGASLVAGQISRFRGSAKKLHRHLAGFGADVGCAPRPSAKLTGEKWGWTLETGGFGNWAARRSIGWVPRENRSRGWARVIFSKLAGFTRGTWPLRAAPTAASEVCSEV